MGVGDRGGGRGRKRLEVKLERVFSDMGAARLISSPGPGPTPSLHTY